MRVFVSTILLVMSTAVLAQEPAMKPGLWEVKMGRQVMDGQDLSAQMASVHDKLQQAMAGMSPEQRKQLGGLLGAKAAPVQGGAAGTRICISAAMAARDKPMVDPQGRCEPATVHRSGNTVEFEFNCTFDGRHSTGKGKSTSSGDTISTSVDMTMTDARGQHTLQTESQMIYAGADCQGIKPVDEIARDALGSGH